MIISTCGKFQIYSKFWIPYCTIAVVDQHEVIIFMKNLYIANTLFMEILK